MAKVLTTDSIISCSHSPGRVHVAGIDHKLKVQQTQSVLLQSDVQQGTVVDNCPIKTDTTQMTHTCTQVTAVTKGATSKLTVATVPVLLDTIEGATDGFTPAPPSPGSSPSPPSPLYGKLSVTQVQSKLVVKLPDEKKQTRGE